MVTPTKNSPSAITSPLKWPGGKRWLLEKYPELLPADFSVYHEPFLGGASTFLHLAPKKACLSDVNQDLINFYQSLSTSWQKLEATLSEFQSLHSESFYYKIRESAPAEQVQKAARLLYLNRTCFNGIYRVNRTGKFNVPIGSKTAVLSPRDRFSDLAAIFGKAAIRCEDFESAISRSKRGDFIFADPPYTVKHNVNGFIKYNESIFSWQDQERLHHNLKNATRRGVKVVVTNANHESIRALYSDFPNQIVLQRKSVMAAAPEFRGDTTELLIRSW